VFASAEQLQRFGAALAHRVAPLPAGLDSHSLSDPGLALLADASLYARPALAGTRGCCGRQCGR
jgi:hypothetical protein